MHPLLARQVARAGMNEDTMSVECRALLARVSQAYTDADQDRYRLELSRSRSPPEEMSELAANLAAERDRLRALFNSAAVGMSNALHDGTIIDCNDAYARMIGRTREEVTGRRWVDFVHPEEREAAWVAATEGFPRWTAVLRAQVSPQQRLHRVCQRHRVDRAKCHRRAHVDRRHHPGHHGAPAARGVPSARAEARGHRPARGGRGARDQHAAPVRGRQPHVPRFVAVGHPRALFGGAQPRSPRTHRGDREAREPCRPRLPRERALARRVRLDEGSGARRSHRPRHEVARAPESIERPGARRRERTARERGDAREERDPARRRGAPRARTHPARHGVRRRSRPGVPQPSSSTPLMPWASSASSAGSARFASAPRMATGTSSCASRTTVQGFRPTCSRTSSNRSSPPRKWGAAPGRAWRLARALIVDKHQGELWFDSTAGHGTTFYVRLSEAA